MAKVTFPYVAQYKYYAVCGLTGDTAPCPFTERLKARLAAANITLCPCQNPAPSLDVTATPTQTGGIAHVMLGYGAAPVKLDLVIVRSGGQYLVDDELCTGAGASTSIYHGNGPC